MLKKELFQEREETVPLMDWFGPQFTTRTHRSPRVAFVIPNWVKSMRIQVCGKSILLPLNLQACCQVRGGIPDFLKQDAGKGNSEVVEVDLNLFQVGR